MPRKGKTIVGILGIAVGAYFMVAPAIATESPPSDIERAAVYLRDKVKGGDYKARYVLARMIEQGLVKEEYKGESVGLIAGMPQNIDGALAAKVKELKIRMGLEKEGPGEAPMTEGRIKQAIENALPNEKNVLHGGGVTDLRPARPSPNEKTKEVAANAAAESMKKAAEEEKKKNESGAPIEERRAVMREIKPDMGAAGTNPALIPIETSIPIGYVGKMNGIDRGTKVATTGQATEFQGMKEIPQAIPAEMRQMLAGDVRSNLNPDTTSAESGNEIQEFKIRSGLAGTAEAQRSVFDRLVSEHAAAMAGVLPGIEEVDDPRFGKGFVLFLYGIRGPERTREICGALASSACEISVWTRPSAGTRSVPRADFRGPDVFSIDFGVFETEASALKERQKIEDVIASSNLGDEVHPSVEIDFTKEDQAVFRVVGPSVPSEGKAKALCDETKKAGIACTVRRRKIR